MITFRQIYQRHAQDVHRYATWLCGSAYDADDITAETFARAWAGREKIRTETVKAYLFAIARNLYLKGFRHSQRQADLDDALPDPTPEPDDQAQARLDLDAAMRAMQALPESYRTALLLRAQHGLAYDEIARVLQLPLSTVKARIHRARLKLAALQIGESND